MGATEGPIVSRVKGPNRLKASLEGFRPVDKEGPNLTIAETLSVIGDEDGPPLARKFNVENISRLRGSRTEKKPAIISIGSVADGLGGAGARKRTGYTEKPTTSAYIASREAQIAVSKAIDTGIRLTGLPSIAETKSLLEQMLRDRFSSLREKYPPEHDTGIKSRMTRDFPTTLATVAIQEDIGGKRVQMLWQGDSPIIVLTPDAIYTTCIPGAGDAPMGDVIDADGQTLNSHELTFSADTPVVAVVASDGLIKLTAPSELDSALLVIFGSLSGASTSADISTRLHQEYDRRKAAGGEGDDTTISLVASIGSMGELARLSRTAPVQIIR